MRFANACHWEIELGPPHASPGFLVRAALARIPRVHHPLVAQGIAEVTGGGHTFADACTLWERARTEGAWMRWDRAEGCLEFLLLARDMIDPFAWPAATPRFRADPAPNPPSQRKRR